MLLFLITEYFFIDEVIAARVAIEDFYQNVISCNIILKFTKNNSTFTIFDNKLHKVYYPKRKGKSRIFFTYTHLFIFNV